jgi:hypothetical protein
MLLTGYGRADIPGGESQVAGHCVSILVKYLTLRAKEPTNESSESLDECLIDLITQSVRLYGEVNANRGGTRISSPLRIHIGLLSWNRLTIERAIEPREFPE